MTSSAFNQPSDNASICPHETAIRSTTMTDDTPTAGTTSGSDTTQEPAILVPRATLDEIRECIIDLYEHMPASGWEYVVAAVKLCNRHNDVLQYHRLRCRTATGSTVLPNTAPTP